MSTRASARKRRQLSTQADDVTTPRKSPRKLDTPDWLSDLDIHLSPKATASTRNVASVRKSSPAKRASSSRSLYVFTSSSQSEESDTSPQKIATKSFYSAKSKSSYLTPLERKQLREKLNKSADAADLASSKTGVSPRKKSVNNSAVGTKKTKAAAKKDTRQTKTATKKKATKTKVVAKKTSKSPAKPAKSPKAAKSSSKKVPKKSPRRSIPKRSPWKATSAKKGIHMYMQGLQKAKSTGKSATKGKKAEKTAVKQATTKSKKTPTPRKSTPKKNQEEESDKPTALRGLDFGGSVDEVEKEVTDIKQRIQSLIDTSFDEAEDAVDTPNMSARKRRMKTKEQSFQDDEESTPKKPRLSSPAKTSTQSRSPRKVSTPRRSPQKQATPSKKQATPTKKQASPSKKTTTPRKTQSATALLPRKSPGRGTPQKGGKSPGKSPSRSELLRKASPFKNTQPETPESTSVSSQESVRNTLSKMKEQTRMFPVFTPPTSPSVHSTVSTPSSRNRSPLLKKLTDKDGKEQLTLDVGQKKFGTTICKTCSMVYTLAHPEDEANHSKYHKKYLSYIKFPGWKKETVIQEFHDGRILLVTSDSPKYALKKIEEVRELVDHELGFLEGSSIASKQSCKTLLFVTLDKKVAGCLIAEEISAGYRVIPDDPQPASQTSSQDEIMAKEQQRAWCCQTTPERAVCGISRIWVAATMRRKNIGRRMVDCIRNNFVYGSILTMNDIAFSDPTPDGKGFATKYTGTPSFLVYKYKS